MENDIVFRNYVFGQLANPKVNKTIISISESGIDRPEDYSENFVLQEQELIRCTKNDRWIYIIYIKILK